MDFADWLALREPADAAARAGDLADLLHHRLRGRARLVIHDLGSGTGSMARWLAPRLPGPQHWVLYDRDPELLARAAAGLPHTAGDGSPVSGETRQADITALGDLGPAGAGADLVTASAVLDMLTAAEVDRVVATCAPYPSLLALSVVGRVALTPPTPRDAEVAAAFNAHQRRTAGGRTLLGPDAAAAAVAAFGRRSIPVAARDTPWHLGPDRPELLAAWLRGWLAAAAEQRPDLALDGYARTRLAQAASGLLRAVVHHRDILANPENRGR